MSQENVNVVRNFFEAARRLREATLLVPVMHLTR
jgi:hypothetical protein